MGGREAHPELISGENSAEALLERTGEGETMKPGKCHEMKGFLHIFLPFMLSLEVYIGNQEAGEQKPEVFI